VWVHYYLPTRQEKKMMLKNSVVQHENNIHQKCGDREAIVATLEKINGITF